LYRKQVFAKVCFGNETKKNAQTFVAENIRVTSEVHTDAAKAYLTGLNGVDVTAVPTYNDPKVLNEWLPWVHKFISNAKSWILGTHHGVNSKYFKLYLAEYTYRFNRRHDVKCFFSRALYSCILTSPPILRTIIDDPVAAVAA
jgi:transposase-like protein